MKRYKGILLILAGLATLITGCKKYETFPVDQININRVFDSKDSLGANASAFLNTIYATQMLRGHNRLDGDYLDDASDDAVSSNAAALKTVTLLSTGNYNSGTFSDNMTGPSSDNLWAFYYAGIRNTTIFINNIGVVPIRDGLINGKVNGIGVSNRYILQSEARFLRAYFYFELVKRYGGVPLLGNKVYSLSDNLKLPRNTFDDCIKYIVSECDNIKDSLKTAALITASTTDYGRPTKGTAMALKARALLYAASPLFNDDPSIPGETPLNKAAADLKPFEGYTSYDKNRWKLAATAAADVVNLGAYSLDTAGGSSTPGAGFRDIFLTQNNPELIWVSLAGSNNGTNIEISNAPVGFPGATATGNTSPTQDLVDAYPMQSGLAITDQNALYDANFPYINRDPRLASTVFYNGYKWLDVPLQMYEGGQSKPNNGKQQTVTGYYMHKFMGPSENALTFTSHSEDWVIFRYAEVLLNYAEAENEFSGPDASVYGALELIRQRAGISPGTVTGPGGKPTFGISPTLSQTQMRAVIQNERRLELAFEEHRFFDIRRWKIAGGGAAVMNQPRRGVTIISSFGTLEYNYAPILTSIFPGKQFNANRYLYPIPYDEVVKDPNLKQNYGW